VAAAQRLASAPNDRLLMVLLLFKTPRAHHTLRTDTTQPSEGTPIMKGKRMGVAKVGIDAQVDR
jgi:hypothetical protein